MTIIHGSLEQRILKYDGQIPRYTSYPTAPHFTPEVTSELYASWLHALGSPAHLSLYIHIPFCKQLCWYCGCFTKVAHKQSAVDAYAQLLMQEISLAGQLLQSQPHRVLHIHFGGGSPTMLQPDVFKQVMATLRSNFNIVPEAEIAIEVDPRNVDDAKIHAYAQTGINRISIGAQDFNLEVQTAINRLQPFELVQQCIQNFKSQGIHHINLDLIYGLPKQTVEKVAYNIDTALRLHPDRIALFAYAHVQWMKKHMQLIQASDLPDGLSRLAMYKIASEKLAQQGYQAIGLDHFAQPTDAMSEALADQTLKRNFQGYSTDIGERIIGFGLSAISYSPVGYAQNTLDLTQYKQYISEHKLPIVKGIKLTSEDILRKKVIDTLMCYMAVDLKAICQDAGYPIDYFEKELKALKALEQDELITIKQGTLHIHPQARPIVRVVCSFFDTFFQHHDKKHSRVC